MDPLAIVLYIVLYVAFDILIADSGKSGAFPYNVATVVFLTEFGKFLFSAYFWLAEYLAWNNRSVLIIRNNLATIDLKTKDSKKEKKTKIRKVRFKPIQKRRTCILPCGSDGKIRKKNINTIEGNWPCAGDELVEIRQSVNHPVNGIVMQKVPIPAWESIQSIENLWHRLRSEQTSAKGPPGEHRIEMVFERRLALGKLLVYSAPMAIPAFLYTMWNVLNFEALLRVNLAEYSIVYQINLLFTVLLWTMVFQKSYNWLQWLGIVCMVFGCALTRVGDKDLKFHWSWALLYVMAQAMISAVAGIINEVVYKCKSGGMEQLTLHVQNTALYGYSALFTFVYMLARRAADPNSMKNLLQGFDSDWRPLTIVLLGMVIGLNVAFILKNMNNVVKVFAAAAHAPIEVIVAHFILKTRLTWAIAAAAGLVIAAILLFRLSPRLVQLVPWLSCSCCSRKNKKRPKQSTVATRLLCCCKLPASQELLELEAALDAARNDAQGTRRRSNSDSEKLSEPLLGPLQKIREYEKTHKLPKTHYWSLDTLDVTIDGWTPNTDFQTAVV